MSHEETVSELFHRLLMRHPELIKTLPLPFIPITEQTSLHLSGNFESHFLGRLLLEALFDSLALKHQLPDWIILMEGMSGKKYRYLINNLTAKCNRRFIWKLEAGLVPPLVLPSGGTICEQSVLITGLNLADQKTGLNEI